MARASLKFVPWDHWVGGKMLLVGAPPECQASLELNEIPIARAVVQSDSSVRFFGGNPVLPVGTPAWAKWEVSIDRAADGELRPQLTLERREPPSQPCQIPVHILSQEWVPFPESQMWPSPTGANNFLLFSTDGCVVRYSR